MVGVNDHRKLCAYAIKIKPLICLSLNLSLMTSNSRIYFKVLM